MDKLKKRIFIILLLLLAVGLVGLVAWFATFLRPNAAPAAERPVQIVSTAAQPQQPAAANPAISVSKLMQTPERPKSADPIPQKTVLSKEELTRLEMEELKPFFKDEARLKTAWGFNQSAFTRGSAYAVGITYFNRQRTLGEISAQEQETKQQAYKETLDRMWQRRLDNVPHPPAVQEPAEPTAPDEWVEGPCDETEMPAQSPQNLTCRRGEPGFCAFFENGTPYFCQTKDGRTSYQLNKWGSSVTVTQKTPSGMILTERYYADGKLARATDYDNERNRIILQFDSGNALHLTKKDKNGKVLDKYYFFSNKPYVHYPNGNDMGETNGPWMVQNGVLFIDGKPLYKLPAQKLAPDVCMIFNGYCPLPKMPHSKYEFPNSDMLQKQL